MRSVVALLETLIPLAIAVLAIRRCGAPGWVMLAGSLFLTLASVLRLSFGSAVENNLIALSPDLDPLLQFTILIGISALGTMIFIAGFLLYALKARSQHKRLAELKRILAARNEANL